MTIILMAIGVIVLLVFLLNTKKWIAIGRGYRQSRKDLKDEIQHLRDESQ